VGEKKDFGERGGGLQALRRKEKKKRNEKKKGYSFLKKKGKEEVYTILSGKKEENSSKQGERICKGKGFEYFWGGGKSNYLGEREGGKPRYTKRKKKKKEKKSEGKRGLTIHGSEKEERFQLFPEEGGEKESKSKNGKYEEEKGRSSGGSSCSLEREKSYY